MLSMADQWGVGLPAGDVGRPRCSRRAVYRVLGGSRRGPCCIFRSSEAEARQNYHPTTEGEGVGRQQEMKAFSASRRSTKQEKPYNCGKASPVFLIFPRAAVRLNDGDGLGRPLAWTSTVS